MNRNFARLEKLENRTPGRQVLIVGGDREEADLRLAEHLRANPQDAGAPVVTIITGVTRGRP